MGNLFGSMFEAFDKGGIGMYPISIALLFGVAIIIERIYVLYARAAIDKEAFLKGLKKHIYAGDLDKAISYCAGQKKTPLVSVVKAGLSTCRRATTTCRPPWTRPRCASPRRSSAAPATWR